MKAAPAAQKRLLDLAAADAELTRLTHRRRALPEHAELTEAEGAVRSSKDALVEAETSAGDLDRDITRLERDIDGVRQRTERDKGLLAGGIGAKQAQDLQHELETLARRQSTLEDEQLEVMEQREALGGNLDHARRVLAEAEERLAAVTVRRDTALADLDAAEAGRTRDRAAILPELPEDLLAEYEKRRAGGRVGAGLLRERRCGACRLELDRTFLGRIKAAAVDDVVNCEECDAILVRTGESGL
ncbi:zinc ribbon domain-containing protein [Pseudonocardia pini]|uniref:zinc ribbon domain-containing protein n=1 Tax=Pseudonocardia pini TaxID=2758030 RepID=UPI0028AAB558|nr:C4-type zinc ribbon domain-containing protein [Pseudonocardia pini]